MRFIISPSLHSWEGNHEAPSPPRHHLAVSLINACTPAAAPTPRVIVVTQEVVVTRQLSTPTPAVLVITSTPAPTIPPPPAAPAETRAHEWTDYGGLCLRPDDLPSGVKMNPARS